MTGDFSREMASKPSEVSIVKALAGVTIAVVIVALSFHAYYTGKKSPRAREYIIPIDDDDQPLAIYAEKGEDITLVVKSDKPRKVSISIPGLLVKGSVKLEGERRITVQALEEGVYPILLKRGREIVPVDHLTVIEQRPYL